MIETLFSRAAELGVNLNSDILDHHLSSLTESMDIKVPMQMALISPLFLLIDRNLVKVKVLRTYLLEVSNISLLEYIFSLIESAVASVWQHQA